MIQVVVSVQYGHERQLDLEMPWEVPTRLLGVAIAKAFGLRRGNEEAYLLALRSADGYVNIAHSETLADAQVQFGDTLLLLTIGEVHLATSAGQLLPLGEKITVIGRGAGGAPVDIDLSQYDTEKLVSRKHAQIERREDQYFIKDTGSRNGVLVNGRKIIPNQLRQLGVGDTVHFGGKHGVALIFQMGESLERG